MEGVFAGKEGLQYIVYISVMLFLFFFLVTWGLALVWHFRFARFVVFSFLNCVNQRIPMWVVTVGGFGGSVLMHGVASSWVKFLGDGLVTDITFFFLFSWFISESWMIW